MEAPGIESLETSAPCVAESRENVAERATQDDAKRRGVSALSAGAIGSAGAPWPDPDAALRVAIVAAVHTGDTRRARALLDVLDAKSTSASVLSIGRKQTQK